MSLRVGNPLPNIIYKNLIQNKVIRNNFRVALIFGEFWNKEEWKSTFIVLQLRLIRENVLGSYKIMKKKPYGIFFALCFCSSICFPINYLHNPEKIIRNVFRGVDILGEFLNKIRKSSRIDLQSKLTRKNVLGWYEIMKKPCDNRSFRIKSLKREEAGNSLEFIIDNYRKSYFILGIHFFIFGYSRISSKGILKMNHWSIAHGVSIRIFHSFHMIGRWNIKQILVWISFITFYNCVESFYL